MFVGDYRAISLAVLGALVYCTGCETTGRTKPQSTVAPMAARRASTVVSMGAPGRTVGEGGGQSMAPIFTDGTLVVIHPIAYEDLQPEMIVAYRDKFGGVVVHKLVVKRAYGWVARGIGNAADDDELVTAGNLLGVVYATFVTKHDG